MRLQRRRITLGRKQPFLELGLSSTSPTNRRSMHQLIHVLLLICHQVSQSQQRRATISELQSRLECVADGASAIRKCQAAASTYYPVADKITTAQHGGLLLCRHILKKRAARTVLVRTSTTKKEQCRSKWPTRTYAAIHASERRRIWRS